PEPQAAAAAGRRRAGATTAPWLARRRGRDCGMRVSWSRDDSVPRGGVKSFLPEPPRRQGRQEYKMNCILGVLGVLAVQSHYPQRACGGLICPAAASAFALTCNTRRNPSESAWSNSPIASIDAFASEYSECGTSATESKITRPLCSVAVTVPVTISVSGRSASRIIREQKSKP